MPSSTAFSAASLVPGWRLDARAADFETAFVALLGAKREVSEDVDRVVAAIIEDVVARGDEALADYSRRFDRVDVKAKGLRISKDEITAARAACSPKDLEALGLAATRIRAFHLANSFRAQDCRQR